MKYFRQHDRTVGALIVFDKRNENARRRDRCAIERMSIAELAVGIFIADIEASALEVMEI